MGRKSTDYIPAIIPTKTKVDSWTPADLGAQGDYLALPINALYSNGTINCQTYLKMGSQSFIELWSPGLEINSRIKEKLRENNHSYIYVKASDSSALNQYLASNLNDVLENPATPLSRKTDVLYNTTSFIISEVMVDPTSAERTQGARQVVRSAVKLLADQPQALGSMIEVSSYDYYTYTHCVHVMTYSLALAGHLGVSSLKELESIGSAALLHDVGKIYIDRSLITKNGTLSADEFEEVKKHPELGYQALAQTQVMGDSELLAVRMHHEKLNGKGYPFGLTQNHLNQTVRIITCMDIYDALATRRSYRDALTPYEALQVMRKMVDTMIDGEVFRKLVVMLGAI